MSELKAMEWWSSPGHTVEEPGKATQGKGYEITERLVPAFVKD